MIYPKIIKGASWTSPPQGFPLHGEHYLRCACKSWYVAKRSLDTVSFRIAKEIKHG